MKRKRVFDVGVSHVIEVFLNRDLTELNWRPSGDLILHVARENQFTKAKDYRKYEATPSSLRRMEAAVANCWINRWQAPESAWPLYEAHDKEA